MLAYILSIFSKLSHLILGIGSPTSFPPPLSREREAECLRLRDEGDEDARQELILHNLRLVSHIVRKYYSSVKNQEDLVSIGSIGLTKAVDTYRTSAGVKLATYAAKCIQNEILMYLRSQRKLSNEISINETIDVDRDGNPLTYIDVIAAEDSTDEELDRITLSGRAIQLVQTVLTERERRVIELRYGLFGKKALTQREVADLLNISRSYVSRIEKCALDKLAERLRGQV